MKYKELFRLTIDVMKTAHQSNLVLYDEFYDEIVKAIDEGDKEKIECMIFDVIDDMEEADSFFEKDPKEEDICYKVNESVNDFKKFIKNVIDDLEEIRK